MLIFHLKLWDRSARCSCVSFIYDEHSNENGFGSLWIFRIFESIYFVLNSSVFSTFSRVLICKWKFSQLKLNHWMCKNMQIHIAAFSYKCFFFQHTHIAEMEKKSSNFQRVATATMTEQRKTEHFWRWQKSTKKKMTQILRNAHRTISNRLFFGNLQRKFKRETKKKFAWKMKYRNQVVTGLFN